MAGRSHRLMSEMFNIPEELDNDEDAECFSDIVRELSKEMEFNRSDAIASERMKVYLRIRPLTARETRAIGDEQCLSVLDEFTVQTNAPVESKFYKTHARGKQKYQFQFSKIYNESTGQKEFFCDTMLDLVKSFVKGENCMVFSYGVTNSGKTYTIQGEQHEAGVLPRTLDYLFSNIELQKNNGVPLKPDMFNGVFIMNAAQVLQEKHIKQNVLRMTSDADLDVTNLMAEDMGSDMSHISYSTTCSDTSTVAATHAPSVQDITEKPHDVSDVTESSVETSQATVNLRYSVWVNFSEIYNEQIYDLLEDVPSKKRVHRLALKLSDDKNGCPYVKGLKNIEVESPEEALRLMVIGQRNLRKACTIMNHNSSRSHCIFTIKVIRTSDVTDPTCARVSMMSLCDLAGSERQGNSRVSGERLKEAGNINNSLHCLGRCIETLRNNQGNTSKRMIPFRNSKLTRLFQNFFLGNGKAAMIVNVNAMPNSFDEMLHVLKFSTVAKQVMIETAKPDKCTSSRSSAASDVSDRTADRGSIAWADPASMLEEDENNEEDSSSADESDEYDQKELLKIIEQNAEKIKEMSKEKRMDEWRIRQEVVSKLTETFSHIENSLRERLREAEEEVDANFERKIQMVLECQPTDNLCKQRMLERERKKEMKEETKCEEEIDSEHPPSSILCGELQKFAKLQGVLADAESGLSDASVKLESRDRTIVELYETIDSLHQQVASLERSLDDMKARGTNASCKSLTPRSPRTPQRSGSSTKHTKTSLLRQLSNTPQKAGENRRLCVQMAEGLGEKVPAKAVKRLRMNKNIKRLSTARRRLRPSSTMSSKTHQRKTRDSQPGMSSVESELEEARAEIERLQMKLESFREIEMGVVSSTNDSLGVVPLSDESCRGVRNVAESPGSDIKPSISCVQCQERCQGGGEGAEIKSVGVTGFDLLARLDEKEHEIVELKSKMAREVNDFDQREKALIHGYTAEIEKYKSKIAVLKKCDGKDGGEVARYAGLVDDTEAFKGDLVKQLTSLQEELEKRRMSEVDIEASLTAARAITDELEGRLSLVTSERNDAMNRISNIEHELEEARKDLGDRIKSETNCLDDFQFRIEKLEREGKEKDEELFKVNETCLELMEGSEKMEGDFREMIKRLEEEKAALDKRVMDLTDGTTTSERTEHSEESIEQVGVRAEELMKYKSLEKENEVLTTELESLKTDRAVNVDRSAEMESEKLRSLEINVANEEMLLQNESVIKELKEKLCESEKLVSRLECNDVAHVTNIEDMKTNVQVLQAENSALEIKVKESNKKKVGVKGLLSKEMSNMEEKMREIESLNKKVKEAELQKDVLHKRLRELEISSGKTAGKLETEKTALKAKSKETESLWETVEKLEKEKANLQGKVRRMEDTMQQQYKENSELQANIDEQSKDINKYIQEVNALQECINRQKSDWIAKKNDADTEISEISERMEKMSEQTERLETENTILMTQVKHYADRIVKLEERPDSNEDLKKSKGKEQALREMGKLASASIQERNAEITRLNESLKMNESKVEDLHKQLSEVQQENDELSNEITKIQSELKSEKSTLEARLRNSQDELKEMKRKLQETEEELRKYENVMEQERLSTLSLQQKLEKEREKERNKLNVMIDDGSKMIKSREAEIVNKNNSLKKMEREKKEIEEKMKMVTEKHVSEYKNVEKMKSMLEDERSKLENVEKDLIGVRIMLEKEMKKHRVAEELLEHKNKELEAQQKQSDIEKKNCKVAQGHLDEEVKKHTQLQKLLDQEREGERDIHKLLDNEVKKVKDLKALLEQEKMVHGDVHKLLEEEQVKLKEVEKKLKDETGRIKTFREQADKDHANSTTVKEELEQEKELLKQSEKEHSSIIEQLKSATDEVKKKEAQVKSHKSSFDDLLSKMAQEHIQFEAMKAECSKHKDKVDELTAIVREQESAMEAQDEMLNRNDHTISVTQSENQKLTREKSELTSGGVNLKLSMTAMNEKLSAENLRLKEDVAEMKRESHEELASVEARVTELTQKLDTEARLHSTSEASRQKMENVAKEHNWEIKELEKMLSEKRRENEVLKSQQKSEEKQSQSHQHGPAVEELRSKLQGKDQMNRELQREVTRLQAEVNRSAEDKEKELKEWREQRDKLVGGLEAHMKKLANHIEELTEENKHLHKERESESMTKSRSRRATNLTNDEQQELSVLRKQCEHEREHKIQAHKQLEMVVKAKDQIITELKATNSQLQSKVSGSQARSQPATVSDTPSEAECDTTNSDTRSLRRPRKRRSNHPQQENITPENVVSEKVASSRRRGKTVASESLDECESNVTTTPLKTRVETVDTEDSGTPRVLRSTRKRGTRRNATPDSPTPQADAGGSSRRVTKHKRSMREKIHTSAVKLLDAVLLEKDTPGAEEPGQSNKDTHGKQKRRKLLRPEISAPFECAPYSPTVDMSRQKRLRNRQLNT